MCSANQMEIYWCLVRCSTKWWVPHNTSVSWSSFWWTFPALNWRWGNTPKSVFSWNLCCCNNSYGCATHPNKMIIISLLDKYYKLYCLDFCGNSTQQRTKRKTEPINLLSSITAVTQILGDGYTHTYLVIYIYIYIYMYIYIYIVLWECFISTLGNEIQK